MGYIKKACKLTHDQVKELRAGYNRIRLIKNQMGRIKHEVAVREAKLTLMRVEAKEIKLELIEKFDITPGTLWSIGEGFSRMDVK